MAGSQIVREDSGEPGYSCKLCPRLAEFIAQYKLSDPDWWNGPVPSFGDADGRVIIVGLAPGLRGANRTGRPFTGDYAGDLLYQTLLDCGFARGTYGASLDDGLVLVDCLIQMRSVAYHRKTNHLLPEIKTCQQFLKQRISLCSNTKIIVALGRVAHSSVIAAMGGKQSQFKFAHGARHEIGDLLLFDSFHCSRYNTNTRRLTPEMFRAVFNSVRSHLDG